MPQPYDVFQSIQHCTKCSFSHILSLPVQCSSPGTIRPRSQLKFHYLKGAFFAHLTYRTYPLYLSLPSYSLCTNLFLLKHLSYLHSPVSIFSTSFLKPEFLRDCLVCTTALALAYQIAQHLSQYTTMFKTRLKQFL